MRLLVLAACLIALPVQAGTVFVTVSGLRNNHGHIRVAICSKEFFLRAHCPYTGTAQAAAGSVVVTIANVPPGTYAAQAFHDENDNGTIDRNVFGLPTEGMGFSNNARMFFGPPRFNAAAFLVADTDARISFSLRYF